ncbi:hypothetical protein OHA88_14855 [Streptomyces sp. NBC_00353]|uniref:Imm32 family immunity protein n=1 Tax=Streptomyces sp. NBC_00353 TaxID=2975722 RepID=UPI002E25C587
MAVQLVGSARLGYSMNPSKNYRKFHEGSDLDIAVISPELFEKAWGELRDIIEDDLFAQRKNQLRKLVFEECIALDSCDLGAEDGVPDGSHLHLEDNNGLKDGSVGLVLERSDDE